jgi:hypothetical protein
MEVDCRETQGLFLGEARLVHTWEVRKSALQDGINVDLSAAKLPSSKQMANLILLVTYNSQLAPNIPEYAAHDPWHPLPSYRHDWKKASAIERDVCKLVYAESKGFYSHLAEEESNFLSLSALCSKNCQPRPGGEFELIPGHYEKISKRDVKHFCLGKLRAPTADEIIVISDEEPEAPPQVGAAPSK